MYKILLILLLGSGAYAQTQPPKPTIEVEEYNATRYRQMLKELKNGKTHGSDFDRTLQKTLLKRLIKMDDSAKKPKKTREKNPADLLENGKKQAKFFPGLIRTVERKVGLQRDARRYKERLEMLEDAILENKDTNKTAVLKLQYAFYRQNKALAERKLETIRTTLEQLPRQLNRYLTQAVTDRNATRKSIQSLRKKALAVGKEIEMAQIEKERQGIVGVSPEKIASLEKKIRTLAAKRSALLKKEIQREFALFVDALKQKDKEVFTVIKRMKHLMKQIPLEEKVQDALGKILLDTARSRLGAAATIQGATREEFRQTVMLFWDRINRPFFAIAQTPVSVFKIFLVSLILLIGIWVGYFFKKTIRNLDQDSGTMAASTRMLLGNLGYYVIVLIVLLIALEVLGIDLSSIAIVAGALSVGVGFGLQNIVSNFVSGIILMFERSIKIGDFIQLDHELKGHIIDMRMRSVLVNTHENIDVIVPNQDFVRNRVINWTMNDQIRGFTIPFSVAYGTDVHEVIRVVTEAVETCGFDSLYTSEDRHTKVLMTELGKSSIDFVLFLWIQGPGIETPLGTLSPYRMLIYDTLREAGIKIPFPQQDIHIRSVDEKVFDLNPKG